MKKLLLQGVIFLGSVPALFSQTTQFTYTGAEQMYIVPACVTEIEITANGAQGNNAAVGGATGGLGGTATGRMAVTPGDTLYIYVGGQNGYNGGGNGGQNGNTVFSGAPGTLAANGGGASDVRAGGNTLNDRVIVAGGGGGAGENGVWPGCQVAGPSGNGGNGGGLVGGDGGFGVGTPCNCGGGGGDAGLGGTQAAGGLHGNYYGNTACLRSSWGPGEDGSLGQGGNGSLLYHNGTGGGGGGGGGYFGGGSGGNGSDTTPGGGGGGGSSFVGTLTSTSTLAGSNTGDGSVSITITAQGIAEVPTGLTGNTTACSGDTLTYMVNPQASAIDFTWTVPNGGSIVAGQGTNAISVVLASGTGNIEVVANTACGTSTPVTISVTVNTTPTVTATAATTSACVYNDSIVLTGTPAGGMWTGTGVNGNMFDPSTGAGSYDLTYSYTDNNSCSNSDVVTIVVGECLGVEENASLNSIKVFPNPAKSDFSVSFGAALMNVDIALVDAAGKVMYSTTRSNVAENESLTISVPELATGIYTLRIVSDSGLKTIQISIAK